MNAKIKIINKNFQILVYNRTKWHIYNIKMFAIFKLVPNHINEIYEISRNLPNRPSKTLQRVFNTNTLSRFLACVNAVTSISQRVVSETISNSNSNGWTYSFFRLLSMDKWNFTRWYMVLSG